MTSPNTAPSSPNTEDAPTAHPAHPPIFGHASSSPSTEDALRDYLRSLFDALGLEPPVENPTHLLPLRNQVTAATHRLQLQGQHLDAMLQRLPSTAQIDNTNAFSPLSTAHIDNTNALSPLSTAHIDNTNALSPLFTAHIDNTNTHPPLSTAHTTPSPHKKPIPTSLRQQRATLHVLLESSLRLLTIAHQWPRLHFRASEAFLARCNQRPHAKLDYDQLYCSPDSTERRCQHILREASSDARILLLGDDDLTSLALAQHHLGPLDVIEYDTRLLDHIHTHAPSIRNHAIDLFLGALPRDLAHAFDAVVLDPPWDDYHAWCFLHKALLALRPSPQARIYMAFCPLQIAWLERKAQRFWRRFAQYGLTIESIHPACHLYPLQETEFQQLLLAHCPPLESHLLQTLRQLPFGFSDLYTLRPIHNFRIHPIRRWFQRWWHLK